MLAMICPLLEEAAAIHSSRRAMCPTPIMLNGSGVGVGTAAVGAGVVVVEAAGAGGGGWAAAGVSAKDALSRMSSTAASRP